MAMPDAMRPRDAAASPRNQSDDLTPSVMFQEQIDQPAPVDVNIANPRQIIHQNFLFDELVINNFHSVQVGRLQ